jgi:hypothetical protein
MPLDLKHSKMGVQLIVNGWASNLRLFWYKVVSSADSARRAQV